MLWSTTHRGRAVLVAASIVLIVVLVYVAKIAPKMPDFEVYQRAGTRALAAEPLYRTEDGHYQLKYLPAFAVLMIPVALADGSAARGAWFVMSLGSLILLVAASLRLCADKRKTTWLLATITVALMAKFYARELVLGQVNAPFAAAVAGAMLAMRARREWLGAGLIVLAIVLKPYGVILVPWVVARRNWRSITGLAAGLSAMIWLPMVRYSPGETVALHAQWWATVRDSTAANLANPDNISWLAMVTRWFGDGAADARTLWSIPLVALGVTLAWVWRWRDRVSFPEWLEASLLLLLIPVLSPQGWDYVLLLATPAIVCLVNYERALPVTLRGLTWVALVLTGLTFYDVMGREAYHAFLGMSGLTLSTFVLAGALVELRRRGLA